MCRISGDACDPSDAAAALGVDAAALGLRAIGRLVGST
jgi:hypothetical protein